MRCCFTHGQINTLPTLLAYDVNIISGGASVNFDMDGNLTGGSINIGLGINTGGSGTITGTASVRRGLKGCGC